MNLVLLRWHAFGRLGKESANANDKARNVLNAMPPKWIRSRHVRRCEFNCVAVAQVRRGTAGRRNYRLASTRFARRKQWAEIC